MFLEKMTENIKSSIDKFLEVKENWKPWKLNENKPKDYFSEKRGKWKHGLVQRWKVFDLNRSRSEHMQNQRKNWKHDLVQRWKDQEKLSKTDEILPVQMFGNILPVHEGKKTFYSDDYQLDNSSNQGLNAGTSPTVHDEIMSRNSVLPFQMYENISPVYDGKKTFSNNENHILSKETLTVWGDSRVNC